MKAPEGGHLGGSAEASQVRPGEIQVSQVGMAYPSTDPRETRR